MSLEKLSENKCFGGRQLRYRHTSQVCRCPMTFSLYLPAQAETDRLPLLTWLSGLTCTDENFVTKAGAQQFAAAHGIAVLAPDTSPRGEGVPDDPQGAYDFGLGAGFYVNASESPWADRYRMYDYVTEELPSLVGENFPVDMMRQGIFGHSMGGYGALTIALKSPGRYKSVSAFAPIVAPSQVPWGQKAFGGYLGDDRAAWQAHDTVALIPDASERLELLIDQGTDDQFLERELRPELLQEACQAHDHPLTLRMQPGYDHSYFFIATFMIDHFDHHAKALIG